MRVLKSWKTILGATILALVAVVLLPPATTFGGIGEVPLEGWYRSAEAIELEEDGFCGDPSRVCMQRCIDFQGQLHLLPHFECF